MIGFISSLFIYTNTNDNKAKAAADETCYWVGDTAGALWNDGTHWADATKVASSCAAPGSIPDAGTAVIFDASSVNGVVVNTAVNIFSLTLTSAYTGTFDNATNDQSFTVGSAGDNTSGNVTMDNTRTDMGDATWTVWGSFDNYHVTTFNKDLSTLVMRGGTIDTPKELTLWASAKGLYNLTIDQDAIITQPSASDNNYIKGQFIVSGQYSISNGEATYANGADVQITSTGTITGDGILHIMTATKLTKKDGIIDVTNLAIDNAHPASYPILPAVYESENVTVTNTLSSNYSWVPSSGTYTFNGNVTFQGNSSSTGTYTIDNSVNNPNFVFKGNVTISNGTSTLNWTKGTGTITAGGTGAQSLNFLGKTVEDLNVTNTGGTVSLSTNGAVTDGVTVAAGATFDLAGQSLNYGAAAPTVNNGTIKLRGSELGANVQNLDIDSGLVEYYGAGATTYDLPNYGATDFHDLTINSTAGTDTFRPPASFGIGGNFTLTSGTLKNDTNNSNISIAGDVTTAAAPTWTKGTGTITLNGTVAQSIDFHDKSVEDLVISNTADIVTLADGVTTDSLTVDTGASFDLASQPFGFTAASSPTNSGTIYMRGDEVLTNVNDLDTTAGTVVIDGAIAYVSLPNYSYYDLVFTGTGSWLLTNPLSVANDLTVVTGTINAGGGTTIGGDCIVANGTFNSGASAVNVTGILAVVGGSFTAPTTTLNVTGGLYILGGAFNSTSGTINLTGIFGQGGGTFNSTSGTINFANIFSISGGTFNSTSGTLNLGGLYMQAGGTFNGSGTTNMSSDLVLADGVFNAGAATIYLAGNFNHLGGTFTADTGTINFSGTNQIITGDTTFYNLTKSTATANTLFFEAGKTQTVTGTLTLNGASGQLLSLRSTADGTQWNLHLTGTPYVSYVDVKDSNLTGNSIEPSDSVNSGNNSSLWIWPSPTPTSDNTNGSSDSSEDGYYAYNYMTDSIEIEEETSEEAIGQITDKEKEAEHGLAWYWWLLIIVSATTIVIVVWKVVTTKKNTSVRHEK